MFGENTRKIKERRYKKNKREKNKMGIDDPREEEEKVQGRLLREVAPSESSPTAVNMDVREREREHVGVEKETGISENLK